MLLLFISSCTEANQTATETSMYGLPIELINNIKKAVYLGEADVYISKMNDETLTIAATDFVFRPSQSIEYPENDLISALKIGISGVSIYKYDINKDGADEILVVEKLKYESLCPNKAYILKESAGSYEYSNYIFLSDYCLFAVFRYGEKLYILTNHDDNDTRTTKAVGLFEINGNDNNHIYIQETNDGLNYHLLYKNKDKQLSDDIQVYVKDIGIDLIYTDRIHGTFYGNEIERNDLLSDARESNNNRIFWNIYSIDIDNDGHDEYFDRKILYNGDSDIKETTVQWYNPETNQVYPTPFDFGHPVPYFLTQQWFKSINGKTVIFSLFHKVPEDIYLLDARMLENGQTIVLLDYIIDLSVSIELATDYNYGDVNWKSITYNDPDHGKAFPDNISDLTNQFASELQGDFIALGHQDKNIPNDLIVLLQKTLFGEYVSSSVWNSFNFEVSLDSFYDQYGQDISYSSKKDFNKHVQNVYQYSLGKQIYYLMVADSGGSARFVNISIYKSTDTGLIQWDNRTSLDFDAKVIKHNEELFYIELLYNYYSKYVDTAVICKLAEGGFGNSVIVELSPSKFEYKMIYSNHSSADQSITKYIDGIKNDLMAKSQINDTIEAYIGEETNDFDNNRLLRLKSVGGNKDYYEIDFNNDGIVEYLSKYHWFPSNYTSLQLIPEMYQFEESRILAVEHNFFDPERLLIQAWFQEIEGKIYTFRLFLNDGYNYVLNVSLIDGNDVMQIQSYIIAPKKEVHIQSQVLETSEMEQ